jgi:hypothetical protein
MATTIVVIGLVLLMRGDQSPVASIEIEFMIAVILAVDRDLVDQRFLVELGLHHLPRLDHLRLADQFDQLDDLAALVQLVDLVVVGPCRESGDDRHPQQRDGRQSGNDSCHSITPVSIIGVSQ